MSLRKSFFSKTRFGVRASRSIRTLVGSRNTFFSTISGYYGGYYGGVGRSSSGWRGDAPVRRTGPRAYRFHATVKPLLLPASSSYPYQIDLKELITTHAPAVFNLLGIDELSTSAFSEPWDADNPFATLDENGILTYSPRGTMLNNVLTLKVEIADSYHPPSPIARATSVIYGAVTEVPIHGVQGPLTKVLSIQLVNDVLGEDYSNGQFWINQGRGNGTCILGAAGNTMAALGIEDADGNPVTYERVIMDFVQVVDGQGNVIKEPKFKYPNGEPVYRGFFPVMNWASLDPAKRQMYFEQLDNLKFKLNRLRKINPTGYDWSKILNDPTQPDFSDVSLKGAGDVYKAIFSAYNVTSHEGYAIDFVDLIRELESGNKVIASVDSKELLKSRLSNALNEAHRRAGNAINGLESKANHAVWITGINLDDPKNPKIIINDTGDSSGAGAEYPLKDFLAAWEDSHFEYVATGEKAITAEMSYRNQHKGLHETLKTAVFNLRFNGKIDEKTYAELSQSTVYNIKDKGRAEQVLQQAEKDNPGFREELDNFLEAGQADRDYFLEKYGIDPNTVKRIIKEVDIERGDVPR